MAKEVYIVIGAITVESIDTSTDPALLSEMLRSRIDGTYNNGDIIQVIGDIQVGDIREVLEHAHKEKI